MCTLASARVEAETVVTRSTVDCECGEPCGHDAPFEVTVAAVVSWSVAEQEFKVTEFSVVHADRRVGDLNKAETIDAIDSLCSKADEMGIGSCKEPGCIRLARTEDWLCELHAAEQSEVGVG